MSKKKEFLTAVMHEINMLKTHATPEELNRLDWPTFCHSEADRCIYGQMTGYCTSERARELMNRACIKSIFIADMGTTLDGARISNKNFDTANKYAGKVWFGNGERSFQFLSALEAYIFTKNSKNKEILQYMKGEIETLKL